VRSPPIRGGQKHIHISFCFVWERSELTNGANLATLSSLSSISLVGGSCIIVVGRSSPKIGGRRLVQIVYCFSCSSQNGTKCSQQLPALFDEDGAMWLVLGGCPGVVFLCCVGAAVGTYSSRCNHVPAVKEPAAVRGRFFMIVVPGPRLSLLAANLAPIALSICSVVIKLITTC
jgi:hypothetical protein